MPSLLSNAMLLLLLPFSTTSTSHTIDTCTSGQNITFDGRTYDTKYSIIKPAPNNGTSSKVQGANTAVSANVLGTLANGTVFWKSQGPFDYHFNATPRHLIVGFDVGSYGMKVGETRRLCIPENEGYGPAGRPPVIPPFATLIFTLECLSIESAMEQSAGSTLHPLHNLPVEMPSPPTGTGITLPSLPLPVGMSSPPSSGHWVPFLELTDEFNNGTVLDNSKWSTNPSVVGWQGRKPGLFSSANVQVSNGSLQLYARSAARNSSWPKGYDNYTTSAVHSIHQVARGYFEIRARSGNSSISSSFWFHQNNGESWTEIDVYESTGKKEGAQMNSSLMCSHTHIFKLKNVRNVDLPKKCGGCTLSGNASGNVCSVRSCTVLPLKATFDSGFHVYGLLWNATHVVYYVDGLQIGSAMNAVCFDEEIGLDFDRETMFDWMGRPKDGFKEDMPYEIDYVRAWKDSSDLLYM